LAIVLGRIDSGLMVVIGCGSSSASSALSQYCCTIWWSWQRYGGQSVSLNRRDRK